MHPLHRGRDDGWWVASWLQGSSSLLALALATLSCGEPATPPGTVTGSGGGGAGGGEPSCPIPNRLLDDGSCLPPGVQDDGCPAGTLGLEDGSCLPAGIPAEQCAAGFEPSNDGCEPILPAEPCSFGLMAVPGETECHEVAPCGNGPWGDIPVDGTTQHVDGSHNGSSDGTASAPWKTIAEGIAAAEPDALVAIAAGSYPEDLLIQGKAIRLWGVCPEQVEVVGSADAEAAIEVGTGATGAEIHDLAVRGDHRGIYIHDAMQVLVDRVWVHDTAARGIRLVGEAAAPTVATIRGTLVERCHVQGMSVAGTEAIIEGVVVRDTLPDPSVLEWGRGMEFMANNDTDDFSTVQLRGSVVERSTESGLFITGTDATVESTVVRETEPCAADQSWGRGINVQSYFGEPRRSSVLLRGVVVERNHTTGVCAIGADLTIESSVVRDTQPQLLDGDLGNGIELWDAPGALELSEAVIRNSLVEGNHFSGITTTATRTTIESTIMRGNLPRAADLHDGVGLKAQDEPTVTASWHVSLRGSVVADNNVTGVVVAGVSASLEGVVVRGTQPRQVGTILGGQNVTFRAGFSSFEPSIGEVRSSLLEGGYTASLFVDNSEVIVESTVVRDGQLLPDDQRFGRGISVQHPPPVGPAATLVLRDSLVEGNHQIGVAVLDADATIDRSVVRGTLPHSPQSTFGDGIAAHSTATLGTITISHSLVDENQRAGITLFGAHGALSATTVDCNTIALALEPTAYGTGRFDDLGDNSCGCGAEHGSCVALSSGLQPPEVLEPPPR